MSMPPAAGGGQTRGAPWYVDFAQEVNLYESSEFQRDTRANSAAHSGWQLDIILGVITGCVLAIIATNLLLFAEGKAVYTTVNGWSVTMKAGKPGNSLLLRALMADELPATNVAEESVYWITAKDSAGQKLSGQHDYVLHFPAGGLPPNDAFWSLTMTDARKVLVANSIDRYSVGDRSGLVKNADGSIDISIQTTAPAGPAGQLAACADWKLHPMASRISARQDHIGRQIPGAARRGGEVK